MTDRPDYVEVYGNDHSPWVQAVLLGLTEAEIPHRLTLLPPWETFKVKGVMMPAARVDGGPWQLESAEILEAVGFQALTDDEQSEIASAWRGVLHRADSAAHFWGGFSLSGCSEGSILRRIGVNFLRALITLYFFLVIRTVNLLMRPKDPDNFGDQFLPFEDRLKASGQPFLNGQSPDTLDFLLFGIVQCHCSIYVPPIAALQSDPRLDGVRSWIGRMQERYTDYERLYSSVYFAPHASPPRWPSSLDRLAFWLGSVFMIASFPITVPLVAFLAIRNRRS